MSAFDTTFSLDTVMSGYLETLLWASTCYGEGCDDSECDRNLTWHNFDESDFSGEARETASNDVRQFVYDNESMLFDSGLTDYRIGELFAFSRNGHGVGFFDAGTKYDTELQSAARVWGETYLSVSDGEVNIG